MNVIRNLSTPRKLSAIISISGIGFVLITLLAMADYRQTLLEQRKAATQNLVETSQGVLDYFYQQQRSGELSKEQAQAQALTAIGALTYNGSNYFWVNDMHHRMVMNPARPDLNGTDMSDFKDPNGKALIVEFVKTVRAKCAADGG